MKCIFFKPKTKSNSAPELQEERRKKNPALDRASKSSGSLPSPRSIPELYKEKKHNLREFHLRELVEATNGFNRMMKIGEGGFGSVYKGTIQPQNGRGDPIVVAIKKLNTRGFQVTVLTFPFLLFCLGIYFVHHLEILPTFILTEKLWLELGPCQHGKPEYEHFDFTIIRFV